jgi:hypothetical protein
MSDSLIRAICRGVPGNRPCGCFENAQFLLPNNFTEKKKKKEKEKETLAFIVLKI